MFPYTIKYTESESDIKNNNLLEKIDQQCQNTFGILESVGNKRRKLNNFNFVFYYMYNFHNSYFVLFVFW